MKRGPYQYFDRNLMKYENNNIIQDKNISSFVDNKEVFNQRLFDRNALSSQLASVQNKEPMQFTSMSDQYKENLRNKKDNRNQELFKHRLNQNKEHDYVNKHKQAKLGFVDFTETEVKNAPRIGNFINKKNAIDYIKSDKLYSSRHYGDFIQKDKDLNPTSNRFSYHQHSQNNINNKK